MKTVKILNTRNMKVHHADHLGSDTKYGDTTNVYRLQCSLQAVHIPMFLGHWDVTKNKEVNCGRCLKRKVEKEND